MSDETTRGRRRRRRTREQWQEEARRWRSSGLSAKEYAEAHELNDRTLTWWASQLRVVGRTEAGKGGPMFLPVRVTGGDGRGTEPAAQSRQGHEPTTEFDVEVELSNGWRIRFRAGMAPEQVARVVAAMGGGAQC